MIALCAVGCGDDADGNAGTGGSGGSGAVCEDDNPCTTDENVDGQCSFAPVADGTSCGAAGEVCVGGTCMNLTSCGDGHVDKAAGEQCDLDVLDGKSCVDLGFAGGGSLSCSPLCQFDTSQCSSSALTTLRLDGGLSTGERNVDGKVFVPLLPYLSDGAADDSTEGADLGIAIANTVFDELYQDETWVSTSPATFTFPVLNGDYSVHLHFVDWASSTQEPGDRVFHVDLEGERVLSDLDVISEVGKDAAMVRSFDITVTDETVTLVLTSVAKWAEITAVEIVPKGTPHLATTGCADVICDPGAECVDGTCAGPCEAGAVTSSCVCGGEIITSGYCCSGSSQPGPCSAPVCDHGEVLMECNCGGNLVSTGYCCAGSHQTGACSYNVYYVSNDGDDSSAGISSSAPWKSLAKVNGTTFSPGEAVLFKRGDEWSGTLTVSAAGTVRRQCER